MSLATKDELAVRPRLLSRGNVLGLIVLAAFLLAPLGLGRYAQSVLVLVFFAAYVGQAWNIMMGFAGLLSLGHALYVGIGAYVAATLYVRLGVSPLIGLVPAVAAAMATGAVIGLLSFRFRIEGVYFALLTIAFAEFARIGFDNLALTGGAAGLFLPVGGDGAAAPWNLRGGPLFFYYLALALALGALALSAALRRARIGYHWLAVREDPQAAQALGINVTRARMSAVLISAAMTAIAGVFYAFYYNNLFPSQVFDISRSVDYILAPIVGGVGTLVGPLLGAALLVPLGEALIALVGALGVDAPGAKTLLFGLALMAVITLAPSGLWPILKRRLGLRDGDA